MEQPSSSTSRWQGGLLALCGIAFMLWAFSIFQVNTWLRFAGIAHGYTPVAFHDIVHNVGAGTPAANAGFMPGDIVDLRAASPEERWSFRTHWLPDRPSTYLVLRGASERRVTFTPRRTSVDASRWGWYAGAFGALIFAAIIAWRRPRLAQTRVLCLLLIAAVVETCLSPPLFITPWTSLDFGAGLLGRVTLESVVLVAYTTLFGRPLSATRKAVLYIYVFYMIVDTLLGLAEFAGLWSGAIDLWGGPIGMSPLYQWCEPILGYTLILLNVALAFAATRDRERALLFWTMALPFVDFAMALLTRIPGVNSIAPLYNLTGYIANTAEFLTPFAIGYALLNRRLLDVGFALNQAAIFSGVSLIVVGLFMLLEWLIGTWLGRMSHATNLTISAALVLALGFSVRVIHRRVEHVLDRVFFRKRHEAEMAIHNLAERAADAPDATTLVRETKATLEAHADAAFVRLAMDDGKGRYGGVSENDPAILALRDRRSAVDLKTIATRLQGEFAYPMSSRGRLVGVLVLGPKRSGDNYAPDESHAIMLLAHAVGHALRFLTLEKALEGQHLAT